MTRLIGAVALMVAGCSADIGKDPEAGGVLLERGLWRDSVKFGTPRVDGLSIDALRQRLPADVSKTECIQPVVRSGDRFTELVNLDSGLCEVSKASFAGGTISAEGNCPALAAKVAREAGRADSWVKMTGTYTPTYLDASIDVVITATSPSGATARMTVTGMRKAEKIGECSK